MKKSIVLIIISMGVGILFTVFILNKENIYAKSEYNVFAFQVASCADYSDAELKSKSLPSSLIIKEDNLYNVYVAIYKNIDIVNKMLVYFENNDINIYLKSITISNEFYNKLDNYEDFIINSDDDTIYNKVNQSILNIYKEELGYD